MLCVYGATGYTGRLVVAELRRRGLETVVSGRSADKLAALPEPVEARPARLDDPAALRAAFAGADAVINCAGPFVRLGEPVLRAAVDAGAHYVDTTGEQQWMRRVFEEFDAPARGAGVAAVPAVGFDYVPGDLLAALVGHDRQPLEELTIAYAVARFGMTRGTMRSGIEMFRGGDVEYVGGRWCPAGPPPTTERFLFDERLGSRPVARYPAGEVLTVPRHLDVREVRVRIAASTVAPHPVLAPLVARLSPALGPLARSPVGGWLERGIDRLPEGPSEADRRAARFTIVAVARGTDGSAARGVVRGSDVYGLTAVTAVGIASALAEAGFSASGALAPAQVVDPAAFLEGLAPHGVEVDLPTPVGATA